MERISLKNIDWEKREAEYTIALHPEAIGAGAAVCVSKELLQIAFRQFHLKRAYLYEIQENKRLILLYQKLEFRHYQSTAAKIIKI